MTQNATKHAYVPERSLSGRLSILLTSVCNRLLLASALSSRGALSRSLLIFPLTCIATILRWWSRSYLGRLGWGWTLQTFASGRRRDLEPADIGDAWQQFSDGNVTLKPPSKR
ncbi:MAG: hypothetical protein R2839_01220 [Thermomicrobiales bacterium]